VNDPLPITLPVQRLLVFRALMLGDMICATPALRALRGAWPTAQISLVGMPGLAGWAARQTCIDDFIAFPGWAGLPEQPVPSRRIGRAFVTSIRRQRFDLAVQMHGSGAIVNPLVVAMGARWNAGFVGRQAWRPPADRSRFCRWPERGTEAERLLALTDHLQLPREGLHLDFPLQPADRSAARALLAGLPVPGFATRSPLATAPYGVLHAGSQLPSRRWLPERYAAVADALARQGTPVLLTGSAGEAPLTAAVRGAMQLPEAAHDLAGRTELGTLGALIESARVLVCNDTGVSHIAAALGTPSVVVACGSDVARWAPADPVLHRVFWQDQPCRPCSAPVCPYDSACARAVETAPVIEAALQAAARAPERLHA
jgi:ADP-heptose:LPS heptosyltransferase